MPLSRRHALLTGLTFLLSACASETPSPQGDVMQVRVEPGEVLQLILPEGREGREADRQAYYDTVIPVAESFGFRRHGQLNIRRNIASDYDPGAAIFYSWPDRPSLEAFEAHPDWPAFKAMRSDAWAELKIYNDARTEPLDLRFDPAKFYTVVIAWIDPDNPRDYDRYLDGIAPAVTREGGRFIYKMRKPEFEAHASSLDAPGQITFVEWDSRKGFERVQQAAEYKSNTRYFNSGLSRFEFYWLTPVTD